MIKTCTKCGVEKPFSEFYKDKRYKYGLYSSCKSCKAECERQYRQNNKEKIAERKHQYYQNNKEKYLARSRQDYQNNKEEKLEYNRCRWRDKKEELTEYTRQYRKKQSAGIYKITNTKTGVVYIGCSTQVSIRWGRHKNDLKQNKHDNKLLQKVYNQCGLEGFKFELLEEYPPDTPFEVLEREETRLILEHKAKGIPMYNLTIKINSIDENHLTL